MSIIITLKIEQFQEALLALSVGTCTQAPGKQTLLTFPLPHPCSKEEEEP